MISRTANAGQFGDPLNAFGNTDGSYRPTLTRLYQRRKSPSMQTGAYAAAFKLVVDIRAQS
jgi:hypothetical protein